AEVEDLIVADGFSCQEQIEQQTERGALHLAQVLQLAIRGGTPPVGPPERPMLEARSLAVRRGMRRASAMLLLGAGLAAALGWMARGRLRGGAWRLGRKPSRS